MMTVWQHGQYVCLNLSADHARTVIETGNAIALLDFYAVKETPQPRSVFLFFIIIFLYVTHGPSELTQRGNSHPRLSPPNALCEELCFPFLDFSLPAVDALAAMLENTL